MLIALVIRVAALAVTLAPRRAVIFAGFASAGLSLWLFGTAAAAWSRLRRAGAVYSEIDPAAVELVGDPVVIADALDAMAKWRIANRTRQPLASRIAHRLMQPVLPSQHERGRIARLRG
jgi:hypothetical protein